MPTPPVEQPKPTTKRPRRPSRKSSRDGEDPEPRRKRKSKVDESGMLFVSKFVFLHVPLSNSMKSNCLEEIRNRIFFQNKWIYF